MILDSKQQIQSRVRGCLLGVAIGDALGMPWETMSPEEILAATEGRGVSAFHSPQQTRVKDTAGLAAGSTTDDWQLTAVVARSILSSGGLMDLSLCASYHVRALAVTGFGWGKGTQKAIEDIRDGRRQVRDPLPVIPGQGCGNGVVMKVAPLAIASLCAHRKSREALWKEDLFELCLHLGGLTHSDPDASVSAFAVALKIRALIASGDQGAAQIDVVKTVRDLDKRWENERETLKALAAVDAKGVESFYAAARAKKRAYLAPESAAVTLSLFDELRATRPEDRFRDGMRQVIALGGDTDTNASILGGLLGAQLGEEGIPSEWRNFRQEFQDAVDLADAFCLLFS